MKKAVLPILLFIQLAGTSFQCQKCHRDDIYLKRNQSWVPLRGVRQLSFTDNAGAVANFAARGLDTTIVVTTFCGDTYRSQSITNTLYLNTAKTDSVHFVLSRGSVLQTHAISNNTYNFSMDDVFGKAKEEKQAKKLSHFTLGNKTYDEVILIFRNDYFPDILDSVMIANNAGIIGFKYYGKRYASR